MPNISLPERESGSGSQRTRNAQAQADLRARRKQYIKSLEDTVSSLEACVRQLREQNNDLQRKLSDQEAQQHHYPGPSSPGPQRELIDRLTRENTRLHGLLADVGLAAAAASKLAKVGKDPVDTASSVPSIVQTALPVSERHDSPHRWTKTHSIQTKSRRVSQTKAFASETEARLARPSQARQPSCDSSSSSSSAVNLPPVLEASNQVLSSNTSTSNSTPSPSSLGFSPQLEEQPAQVQASSLAFRFDPDLSFLQRTSHPSSQSNWLSNTQTYSPMPAMSLPLPGPSPMTHSDPNVPAPFAPPFSATAKRLASMDRPAEAKRSRAAPPPPPEFTQAVASYAWNLYATHVRDTDTREPEPSASIYNPHLPAADHRASRTDDPSLTLFLLSPVNRCSSRGRTRSDVEGKPPLLPCTIPNHTTRAQCHTVLQHQSKSVATLIANGHKMLLSDTTRPFAFARALYVPAVWPFPSAPLWWWRWRSLLA